MTNDIKIGISRNRLFDFQNVVSFSAQYSEEFIEKEMQKAINMLSVREPIITSTVELNEEKDAFLKFDRVKPVVNFIKTDIDNFINEKINKGLNFNEQLFEFFVLNKNTLVIFSHTVVSDSKSLLILARELVSYYNKDSVQVEPKGMKLFSTDDELPLSVHSFVADKVTEVLENEWLLKPRYFDLPDYQSAKESFFRKNGAVKSTEFIFDSELCEKLVLRCQELKVDFSSCVLYALLKVMKENTKLPEKECRANVQVDRRPYFVDNFSCMVGALNGTLSLEIPKNNAGITENVKNFHKTYYKKFSECFNAFYNEIFLSRVSGAFLDSCFMYKAGVYKNKSTKKLATLYGCQQKFLFGFSSINLKQRSWEKLSTFHHIRVKEPHKSNENVSFCLILSDENKLFVEYNSTSFDESKLEQIFRNLESVLNQI